LHSKLHGCPSGFEVLPELTRRSPLTNSTADEGAPCKRIRLEITGASQDTLFVQISCPLDPVLQARLITDLGAGLAIAHKCRVAGRAVWNLWPLLASSVCLISRRAGSCRGSLKDAELFEQLMLVITLSSVMIGVRCKGPSSASRGPVRRASRQPREGYVSGLALFG
jgi:hypothetical protein